MIVFDPNCRIKFRNDENIISSISATDIVFYDYFGKWDTEPFTNGSLKLFLNHSLILRKPLKPQGHEACQASRHARKKIPL